MEKLDILCYSRCGMSKKPFLLIDQCLNLTALNLQQKNLHELNGIFLRESLSNIQVYNQSTNLFTKGCYRKDYLNIIRNSM